MSVARGEMDLERGPGGEVVLGARLDERVWEGAFAEVWRARRVADGAEVAVKRATSDLGARMLRAERGHQRGLPASCQGVVVPFEAFEDGARPVARMPWVEGGTLRGVLAAAAGEDDRARAIGLLIDAVHAVARLHIAGLVHGDLKPENVLVKARSRGRRRDPTPRVLLTDFGLARDRQALRREQTLAHSMRTREDQGLTGGTLAYMPPEAVKGGEPTWQGDVYALGVMLHEALLGRRPDKAVGVDTVRHLVAPGALEVLKRALAFSPEDRFKNAWQLAEALEALRDDLTRTGLARRLRGAARVVLAGLAAFFVTLRYVSVALLLAGYVAMLYLLLRTDGASQVLGGIGLAAALILHLVVRWEGPESSDEAAARRRAAR